MATSVNHQAGSESSLQHAQLLTIRVFYNMADVEMSDAPVGARKADGVVSKATESKKKFEVKKVHFLDHLLGNLMN